MAATPLALGADDIVRAVADHDGVAGLDPLGREDVADEVALRRIASVELGTVQDLEIAAQIEVVDDVAGVGLQLRRGDRQEIALGDKARPASRECRRSGCSRTCRSSNSARDRAAPPRPSPPRRRSRGAWRMPTSAADRCTSEDRPPAAHGASELLHRILHRARDADERIGQRSIEVEQQSRPRCVTSQFTQTP